MKRLYNKYFPTPSYLAMNSCAINISDQSIKYGELSIFQNSLHLKKYGKEKIPEGAVVSGKIQKEDELVFILKKIKEKENLHFVRVSLPEEQMYLFTLSLPKIKNMNIREMILMQLEEHIPLGASDCSFNFDILNEDDQNLYIEVVAIANDILDSYISIFNKAGLTPLSFEIEAQAIARAIVPNKEDGPVMIVDFGDSKTGVSIAKNGIILLTTTLSIGGLDLTNMVAKSFGISFEEAEDIKHKYGLNQAERSQNIFSAVLNGISVLKDELNKQSLYWASHNNDEQIKHIILCGGDANLVGLSEYLELSMKMKVDNANVWVNILNLENIVPDISFEDSLSYATVIGLSLSDYSYNSRNIINILPEKDKKFLLIEYWERFFTTFLFLSIIVLIWASILLFPSYLFSQTKENLANKTLELFNKQNPELINMDINKSIENINLKLNILNNGKADYNVSNKVLDNILSSRIDGITFSQILFNKKVSGDSLVEIHGFAKDRDSLRGFKNKLESNENFFSVDLPISNFLEKTDLNFTISLILK